MSFDFLEINEETDIQYQNDIGSSGSYSPFDLKLCFLLHLVLVGEATSNITLRAFDMFVDSSTSLSKRYG